MPGYNGSGTFVRTHNWTADRNAAIKIVADRHDAEDDAFATGLSFVICKDGQTATTGRIPFAFGIGVADGTVGAPGINFSSDTNSGIYRIGADNIGVAVNGAKVLDIATTGLAVTGTLTHTGVALAPDGSVSAPGYAFTNDTDCGIYRIGANNLGFTINGAKILDFSTSGLGVVGTGVVTSTSASALTVGANGATNPVLKVDASASSVATGISLTGAAAASRAAIAVVSSGTNEGLSIDAKGSGTVRLGATSTGAVEFSRNAVPTANDGAALGTTSLGWADLHGASGFVFNLANSSATLTHSTASHRMTYSATVTDVSGAAGWADSITLNISTDIVEYGKAVTSVATVSAGTLSQAFSQYFQHYIVMSNAATTNVQKLFYCIPALGGASPTGTINTLRVFDIEAMSYQHSGTPTVSIGEQSGLYINNQGNVTTGVTKTTSYAIRILAQSGATNSYAIHSAGGQWVQQDSTASVSTATGCAVFSGGVGIAGALSIGTNIIYDSVTIDGVATAAEFRSNSANKLLTTDKVWSAAATVALSDAATIAVDLSTGINFTVTIAGNRTLGNPTNQKVGQSGYFEVTASGGTRTLDKGAVWKSSNIGWPISIASGQIAYITYFVADSSVAIITGVSNNPA